MGSGVVWGVEWSGECSGLGSGLGSGVVGGVEWEGWDTVVIVVNGTISGTRVRFTVSRPRLTILIQKNFIMNNKCI